MLPKSMLLLLLLLLVSTALPTALVRRLTLCDDAARRGIGLAPRVGVTYLMSRTFATDRTAAPSRD